MDDLVKKLRSPAIVFYEYAADDGAVFNEAADRIESLEKLVRDLLEITALYRAALEGKNV